MSATPNAVRLFLCAMIESILAEEQVGKIPQNLGIGRMENGRKVTHIMIESIRNRIATANRNTNEIRKGSQILNSRRPTAGKETDLIPLRKEGEERFIHHDNFDSRRLRVFFQQMEATNLPAAVGTEPRQGCLRSLRLY